MNKYTNSNYTKVDNKLVAKYGVTVAYIYAKLHYRMNLSHKNKHFKDSHGHYIVYKVNDLAKDCHMSRGTVIRSLKKLEKGGSISKDRTMFCNHIYLPKFNNDSKQSSKVDKRSSKSGLSREHNTNNQELNNNCVYSSSVNVKKAKSKFPTMTKIKQRFNPGLVNYAINHVYQKYISWGFKVYSKSHFIYGILRRWQRKGLKTLNAVMISEHDSRAVDPKVSNGPAIPIFQIR